MKTTNKTSNVTPQVKKAPENKDNLDSRSSEEYDIKGSNMLHNKKTHHNNMPKKTK